MRQRTWGAREVEAVLALRQQYPRWGKAKLAILLARQGIALSVSMVGRILHSVRQRRLLVEPQRVRATATACTAIAATVATGNVSFTCRTPAHALGFVDVTVTTTLGLVNATGTNAYEYINGGGVGTTPSATALTSSRVVRACHRPRT